MTANQPHIPVDRWLYFTYLYSTIPGATQCGWLEEQAIAQGTIPLCDISLGCGFFTGPGQSLFLPSLAAWGQCFLATIAASVPCGVVCALAGPSSWRTGVVLVVARLVLRFLLPTLLHVRIFYSMLSHVSVCVRPVVLVVSHLPPHVAICVRPNYSTSLRSVRGHYVHLHGFCGCRAHLRGWCMLLCG